MIDLIDENDEPELIDLVHLPAVLEGLAQAKRHEFATEKEIEAVFLRFSL